MTNIFIYSPRALENGRGGEISSMELASGLKKFYKIMFMDSNILTGKKLLSKKIIKARLSNINLLRSLRFACLNISNRNFTFPFPNEIRRLFKAIKRNDIIYTSIHNIKMSIIFILFSLIHRRGKYIIGYRKPLHSKKLFSLYNLKYRLSILLFSLLKKRVYHHVMSIHAKKYLEQFYDAKTILHIVHGIDLTEYSKNDIKKKSDNLSFIYIGYLDDIHKGVNVLIEAIKNFIDANPHSKTLFEFCGMGPLESKVKELEKNYPENVKYNGYISNDLIPRYYKKSDVFLFSSRVEPFPRAIMEALGGKLVILSSKTIGSVELLNKEKFVFFIRELSPNAIEEKIVEIYELWSKNPEYIKTLQEEAYDFVLNNYSTAIEVNMFKSVIDNIVHN